MTRRLFLFAIAWLAIAAHAEPAKVLRDVRYGPHARQRFDVYLPEQPAGPVLFMVHGGAWAFGDKAAPSVVQPKADYWLAQGYVFVSTNYRLVPQANPLEQAADVARALAEAQRRAPSWGADPKRFVLMGHSAGGHLVSLLNAAPALATKEGAQLWKAAVSLDSGALDVVELMREPHARLYDRAFGADSGFWEKVSPVHVLGAGSPPVLMICSRSHKRSCEQSLTLEKKASKFGQHVVIWTTPMSHDEINRKMGAPGIYTDSVARWISSIL